MYYGVDCFGIFWSLPPGFPLKSIQKTVPLVPLLYARGERRLLFDVSWYRKRINLEVCHVLTDGTGALQFLRTLVARYLTLCHPELGDIVILDYGASPTEKKH